MSPAGGQRCRTQRFFAGLRAHLIPVAQTAVCLVDQLHVLSNHDNQLITKISEPGGHCQCVELDKAPGEGILTQPSPSQDYVSCPGAELEHWLREKW